MTDENVTAEAPNGQRQKRPAMDRFNAKVKPDGETGCWTWAGAIRSGYGAFRDGDGRVVAAHVFAHETASGTPVPIGCVVMHSCDNPLCVNPDHLKAGTQAQNMRDASLRGRLPTKLSDKDVVVIWGLHKLDKWSVAALVEEYRVSRAYVRSIINQTARPHAIDDEFDRDMARRAANA